MIHIKSIEQQLEELMKPENLSKSATISGRSIEEILVSEAERLKTILAKHIQSYYSSYSPSKYVRWTQDNLARALQVETTAKDMTVAVYFNENVVWGESVVDVNKWGWGFEPILIDTGWRVKSSVSFANVYRFGYYEGYNFIQKAIDEFGSTNPYGLHVYVKISPKANSEFGGKFKLSAKARDIYDRMGF